MTSSTDSIEKTNVLRASKTRVWQALTNAQQFGSWFGMKLEGPFVQGQSVAGTLAATTVDAHVAKAQKPHEGMPIELFVESLEPETLFSFRWHPFAVDRGVDYSSEPTTLVAFALRQIERGIWLTITESGFDALPETRRAAAFAGNETGWGFVCQLLEKYLAK